MPPEPTSSSSSNRPARRSPTIIARVPRASTPLTEGGLERLVPDAEGLVELGVGDDERDEHAEAVAMDPARDQEQAAGEGGSRDCLGELGRRLLAGAVGDQLDRQHRADAADVADLLVPFLPAEHPAA